MGQCHLTSYLPSSVFFFRSILDLQGRLIEVNRRSCSYTQDSRFDFNDPNAYQSQQNYPRMYLPGAIMQISLLSVMYLILFALVRTSLDLIL